MKGDVGRGSAGSREHAEVWTVELPSGRRMPVFGQGTWGMGNERSRRKSEVAALRLGLELGLTLIDTAEMYSEGGAERVVSEAIAGARSDVYLVSKVYPHNATRQGAIDACSRSLERLETDYLDLYLLHWRGRVPLDDTLDAFRALAQRGMIRDYGVSNFDQGDMEELVALPGGNEVAANQVLYNPRHRGIEWDLLPWCRERSIPIMAYSPVEQGALASHAVLNRLATRTGVTPAQIALAWLLGKRDVVVIPKAAKPEHVRENRAALDVLLTDDDLAEIDHAFPWPRRKVALEMR